MDISVTNMATREGMGTFFSTPINLLPPACEDTLPCAQEGCAISILKHIGHGEEDDLKIFVDAIDDRSAPTYLIPYGLHDCMVLALSAQMCCSHLVGAQVA
jgi:hypothetical protein